MSTPSDTLSLSSLVGLLHKPRDDRTIREQRCIDNIEDTLRKCQLKYIVHFDGDPDSIENEEAIANAPRTRMTDTQLDFLSHVLVWYLSVPSLAPLLPDMMRLHGFSCDDRMPLLGEEYGWSGSCYDW